MTTLKITLEDENVEIVKKLLQEGSFVKSIEQDKELIFEIKAPESALERIKKIQAEIGDKSLFKEIKDPVEWQREIRKEWDRDF